MVQRPTRATLRACRTVRALARADGGGAEAARAAAEAADEVRAQREAMGRTMASMAARQAELSELLVEAERRGEQATSVQTRMLDSLGGAVDRLKAAAGGHLQGLPTAAAAPRPASPAAGMSRGGAAAYAPSPLDALRAKVSLVTPTKAGSQALISESLRRLHTPSPAPRP